MHTWIHDIYLRPPGWYCASLLNWSALAFRTCRSSIAPAYPASANVCVFNFERQGKIILPASRVIDALMYVPWQQGADFGYLLHVMSASAGVAPSTTSSRARAVGNNHSCRSCMMVDICVLHVAPIRLARASDKCDVARGWNLPCVGGGVRRCQCKQQFGSVQLKRASEKARLTSFAQAPGLCSTKA